MSHSTQILIIKALDGLAARAVATAENIANAGTPGFRPLRVSFEDALKSAATQGDDAVKALEFTAQPAAAGSSDSKLRLDLEMATASTTALRYSALIAILDRQSQALSTVIRGNG